MGCKKTRIDKFAACNVYEDLRRPCLNVLTIFFGQCLLFILYLIELFDLVPRSVVPNHGLMEGHYTYWVCGVMAIQMSAMFGCGADSALGRAFNGKVWGFLYTNRRNLTLVNDNDEEIV